jgi:hypothetical protein
MDFLPAIRLPALDGHSNVDLNMDGSLMASMVKKMHCVYIHKVDEAGKCIGDAVVVGTPGTPGREYGQLCLPKYLCFVHRNGVDTLLISDPVNDRIVEVTTSTGMFLRTIQTAGFPSVTTSTGMFPVSGTIQTAGFPFGVAYCGKRDVIAVTLQDAHALVLLNYTSGTLKLEAAYPSAAGRLSFPHGVAFTQDGDCVLVADCYHHRVSKFSADSGEFLASVATIRFPRDVFQCADGSIIVAQGDGMIAAQGGRTSCVVCIEENDGGTARECIRSEVLTNADWVFDSVADAPTLKGVIVSTFGGGVFLLRDAWVASSSRCAWVSASCIA